MCNRDASETSKSFHRQVWVKVNKEVDEGVAELVSLLNQVDRLETVSSCEGVGGEWGHVYFYYGDWQETCHFMFNVLRPALRHIGEMQFSVGSLDGCPMMGDLGFRGAGLIPEIVHALKPVLT